MDTPQQYPTMWTTGYVGGVKVSFTFPIRNEMEAYAQAKAITDKLIADGFTVEPPGLENLEQGQTREKVNGVMRRSFLDDDGSTVPVIDIYPDSPVLGRRCVFYYLNDETQIAEFETATGLKLATMPVYPESQLNRVEKPELAKKFIVPVTGNVFVVFKDNPAYDPNAAKKKAKHLFVRWEAATPTPQPPAATAPAAKPDGEPVDEFEGKQVVITRAVKTGFVEGMGDKRGDKYDAWARETDGGKSDIRVTVFPECVAALQRFGYEFSESDNLNIPVPLTTRDRGLRRIDLTKLTPRKGTPVDNLNWALIWPKVRGLYPNGSHMTNSVNKLKHEGAFKNCPDEAAAIAVIVTHKNGQAEGQPA